SLDPSGGFSTASLGSLVSDFPAPSAGELSQIAAHIGRCIPDLATRSSVALVQPKGELLQQIGSGTLLVVAENRFLVTAAHVTRSAVADGRALGVSGSIDERFVATTGRWVVSGEAADDDQYDIAIYEFNADQASRFPTDSFVRISDAIFEEDLSSKFFLVTGFPGMWSTTTSTDAEPMKSRLLQYGTFALQGTTTGLVNFDPALHLLLEATPEHTIDGEGQPVSFRTRTGYAAQIPGDLGGVSGSSVWAIGDLRIPPADWSVAYSRLVGVETSVYRGRGAIKATRWKAITTLLYEAFPVVRPTIEMYVSMYQS
ncbi:MAG: hypothetical protein ABI728_15810, partial [Betaproteobacteria bacterium]